MPTTRDVQAQADTDHDQAEHSPMLERYLNEEDRIQRLFARLAEQDNKARQEKDEEQVNGVSKPKNSTGQGVGRQGTNSDEE
ncbi:MAG: hypothetical protein Q9216_004535 [Gyalolechia sp. 2 TL-2023]